MKKGKSAPRKLRGGFCSYVHTTPDRVVAENGWGARVKRQRDGLAVAGVQGFSEWEEIGRRRWGSAAWDCLNDHSTEAPDGSILFGAPYRVVLPKGNPP